MFFPNFPAWCGFSARVYHPFIFEIAKLETFQTPWAISILHWGHPATTDVRDRLLRSTPILEVRSNGHGCLKGHADICSLNTECHRISLKFIKDLHLSSLELLSHRLFLHRSNCSRPSAMRIPDRMRTPHVSANSLRPANCSKEAQRYLIGLDYWKIFEHIFKGFEKSFELGLLFSFWVTTFFSTESFRFIWPSRGKCWAQPCSPTCWRPKSVHLCIGVPPDGATCRTARPPVSLVIYHRESARDLPQSWFFAKFCRKIFGTHFLQSSSQSSFFLESADITFSTSWKLPWTSSARRRFKPAGFCCNLL